MPIVKYELEMTPANAPVIDQINRLIMGDTYTEETPAKPAAKTEAKAATKTESKPAAKKEESKDTGGDTDAEMSLADFKAVVKKAKADHDEEFCKSVLLDAGAETGPLGRMVSAIDADDYADVVEALEAGPAEKAEEEEDDDGLGDDEEEDTSEVDAEAVKTAAKAYAKEVGRDEAKQIMNDNGAATLTKIADCNQKQLQAMFKAFTA